MERIDAEEVRRTQNSYRGATKFVKRSSEGIISGALALGNEMCSA